MDKQRPTKASSLEEAPGLPPVVPADVLANEVTSHDLEVPTAVGSTAIRGVDEKDPGQRDFESNVDRFLDPNVKLDAIDQLSLMTEFWAKLGHTVPELSEEQQVNLTKTLEANPLQSVVPTPLLGFEGRKAIVERALAFPKQQFGSPDEALWMPDERWEYGRLIRHPETSLVDRRFEYVLRYKLPNGKVTGRPRYMAALKEADQAVEDEDGTTWIFPVLDVRPYRGMLPSTNLGKIYETLSPFAAPETFIATNLLHQANGTPNANTGHDFANEATYKLDEKRRLIGPLDIVQVNWHNGRNRLDLRVTYWDNLVQAVLMRGVKSGIAA